MRSQMKAMTGQICGKGLSPCSFEAGVGGYHSPQHHYGVQQPQSSLNPILFGLLWRPHYLGMVDPIIDHW